MDTTENPKPRKPLNRRQALKLKRKKLRGRVNAARAELAQIEPLLAAVEKQLAEDRERDAKKPCFKHQIQKIEG